MAKTAKRKVGRPAKFKEPRVTLTCRLQERFYEQLKATSINSGRSISEEIERRVERSFVEEDALGGREMQDLAHLMRAIFAFKAKQVATAAGHSTWTSKEWLADQTCYQAATVEVCRTLIEGLPNPTGQQMDDTLNFLSRRLAVGLSRTSGEIEGGSGFIKPKETGGGR